MKIKKAYRYVHHGDIWIQTNINFIFFDNEWLRIDTDGKITVKGSNKNGYAWDGCSPKINLLDLCFGTPDGKTDMSTEKPITYFASLIHDCIYQFKRVDTMSRKDCDRIFWLILKKEKFFWRILYYIGVRVGGIFYGRWKTKKSHKNIKVISYSWKP